MTYRETFEGYAPENLTIVANPFISGDPFTNNPCRRYEYLDMIEDRFPDALIIVGLRNYKSWLVSLWKQYLTGVPHYHPFLVFDAWLEQVFLPKGLTEEANLQYIAEIRKRFTTVLEYRYETLRDNPLVFVKDICKFIRLPIPAWTNTRHKVGYTLERITELRKLYANKGSGKGAPDEKLFL